MNTSMPAPQAEARELRTLAEHLADLYGIGTFCDPALERAVLEILEKRKAQAAASKVSTGSIAAEAPCSPVPQGACAHPTTTPAGIGV